MIRYLEAGESHGKGLVAIIEGLPAGIPVNVDAINQQKSDMVSAINNNTLVIQKLLDRIDEK